MKFPRTVAFFLLCFAIAGPNVGAVWAAEAALDEDYGNQYCRQVEGGCDPQPDKDKAKLHAQIAAIDNCRNFLKGRPSELISHDDCKEYPGQGWVCKAVVWCCRGTPFPDSAPDLVGPRINT